MKNCIFLVILNIALLSVNRFSSGETDSIGESAEAIVNMAWDAYLSRDYGKAADLVQSCITRFNEIAHNQLNEIKQLPNLDKAKQNQELNNVATSLFIQAEIIRLQNQADEAVSLYRKIIHDYPYAYCWDNFGNWFIAVDICRERISDIKSGNVFGDYTSETLTIKAWESFDKKDFKSTEKFAIRCVLLYEKLAKEQQRQLKEFPAGKFIRRYQLLNDIGTCHLILGEVYRELGQIEEAKRQYEKVLKDYSFAQCWDMRGWYWKVADLVKDRMFSIETGVELFDSNPETLTNKAWKSLDSRDYKSAEFFAQRCISLYSEVAKSQQDELEEIPSGKFIPYYWGLNSVGTCYFILGEVYLRQKKLAEAKEMYQKVITDYPFAQCWNPRGWYWKVAKACYKRLGSRLLFNLQ